MAQPKRKCKSKIGSGITVKSHTDFVSDLSNFRPVAKYTKQLHSDSRSLALTPTRVLVWRCVPHEVLHDFRKKLTKGLVVARKGQKLSELGMTYTNVDP